MSESIRLLLVQAHDIPARRDPAIIAIAMVYFTVCAAIAWWAARRTRTSADFFVAGRGVGLLPMATAAMAATLSGFIFIGGPGLLYQYGIGALFISLSASITTPLSAWAMGSKLRALRDLRGAITIPDAIAARYRSPAAQGVAAVALILACIGYIATNVLALGYVVDAVFGTGLRAGIVAGAAAVIAYTVTGGILAGVYTDLFQGMVKAMASLLVFGVVLSSAGGLSGISRTIAAADPVFIGPWGSMPPALALSYFLVFSVGTLGQPHVIHKYYMLRDPRQFKWYPLVMTAVLLVTLLLFFGVGLAVKADVIRGAIPPLAHRDDATPMFLLYRTPAWLAGIVFSGIAAATMGTINAFMSIAAAAVTHDLPRALDRTVANPLRVGRIVTVIVGIAAALVALSSGAAVAFLGLFGWGLFASTLFPALALGFNWFGATRAGALASMITGITMTLSIESLRYFKLVAFPSQLLVAGVSLVAATLVFFAVSWITRRAAATDLDPDIAELMRH